MVLVTKPMFCDMGNHLRPLSEAPDRPEGQELGGGAVGGQEVLQEVPISREKLMASSCQKLLN